MGNYLNNGQPKGSKTTGFKINFLTEVSAFHSLVQFFMVIIVILGTFDLYLTSLFLELRFRDTGWELNSEVAQ